MIDSIYVALSGMLGHQRGLNVISNNVANLNTPGFRGSSVDFADVFTGTPQDGLQSNQFAGQHGLDGGGLDATRTLLDLRAGEQQQTGRGLDLFLKGSGFFVLQDENGAIRYTRDGSFEFNSDGELVAGGQRFKVMTRNATGQLVPVETKGLQISPPKATTKVTFDRNLSPSDADGVTIDPLAVFDQLGGTHTLRVVFSKDSVPTAFGVTNWKLTVFEGTQEIGSGNVELGSGGPTPGSSPLSLTLALKDAGLADISFDFGTVTGFAIPSTGVIPDNSSTLVVQKQDGFGAGTITAETFDAQGVLKISYSNGQTVDGPKLALAQISDEGALLELSDAVFAYQGSQAVTLRDAGDDLQVVSKSLELSNVDLTEQFSRLILMQRGYQASSQVMSTANDMLQELLQLKGGR